MAGIPTLFVRGGDVMGTKITVVRLQDRRPGAPVEPTEWTFQREVEMALYQHGYASSTGAVYRLLQRSGVGHQALPLKKASIAAGLITQQEYDWLYSHLVDARSFTLIPLTALRIAIEIFGRDTRSEALVGALGIERPDGWGESEEGEEEGEEDTGSSADTRDRAACLKVLKDLLSAEKGVRVCVYVCVCVCVCVCCVA